MVQFSSGVSWCGVVLSGFVVCWVLLLVCVLFVLVGCLVVWLCPRFCGVVASCVSRVLLVCVASGCSCVFGLCSVSCLCSGLCCSVRFFAPGAVVVARVVLLCVAPSWCWLLLVARASVLLVLLVVGLLVLLSPLFAGVWFWFVDPAPGSPGWLVLLRF